MDFPIHWSQSSICTLLRQYPYHLHTIVHLLTPKIGSPSLTTTQRKKKSQIFSRTLNIQITYITNNAVCGIFKTSSNSINTYIHSGIYQLQCHTCHLLYRSNRFWHLKQRYKGHIQCITSNNPHSSHAFHILHNKMTMDTWTPPCSFSIQSTTVAKWTHEKAFEFNFFFHLFDFSTARPADTTPPLLLWYITYWQPFSKTHAIIFRFIYLSIF